MDREPLHSFIAGGDPTSAAESSADHEDFKRELARGIAAGEAWALEYKRSLEREQDSNARFDDRPHVSLSGDPDGVDYGELFASTQELFPHSVEFQWNELNFKEEWCNLAPQLKLKDAALVLYRMCHELLTQAGEELPPPDAFYNYAAWRWNGKLNRKQADQRWPIFKNSRAYRTAYKKARDKYQKIKVSEKP